MEQMYGKNIPLKVISKLLTAKNYNPVYTPKQKYI